MSLADGGCFGAYEILRLEGAGGMGEVYRARDTRLNREVALKVLPEQFAGSAERVERFEREAQLLASLNHPNIATIYGVEEHEGVHALVLELASGPTLDDRLSQGAMALDEAMQIGRQVADALEGAHERGIVHRDLKPSNIKVRSDGMVKLLDFGVAKALDPAVASRRPGATTLTAPVATVLGTPGYMSPEQACGQPAGKGADIWAFGCVLFEMLAGKRAFDGGDASRTMTAILAGEPDWSALPADVPPSVHTFLRRCLRRDVKERLRDIGDMRLALDGAFEPAAPGGLAQVSLTPTRWTRVAVVTAVGIVTAAIGLGGGGTTGRRGESAISFRIDAPPGTAFGREAMSPHPALSADGRHLAFDVRSGLGSGSPEERTLWVQTLGELAARPVPGTDGVGFPFWEPQGRFIAFGAGGRLKKVAVSGNRPPQELCACDPAWGGSWGADGTIVFARADGVFRISAEGGEPRPVTRLDESRGEFSHRYPVLLPDGRRFIYLVRSTREEYRGLHLGSLVEPSMKRRLVPDDSNGAIGAGPDGTIHLFFVRDLALLAQPFDESRGELKGEPFVVARPVLPGQTGRLAPFAASNRTLVYRPRVPDRNRLTWIDRNGTPGGHLGTPGADYSLPSLSRDGKKAAVAQLDPVTGKRDIWMFETDRPVSERLTMDPVEAAFPMWPPDGPRLLYASARTGRWSVYSRYVSGGTPEESIFGSPDFDVTYPRDVAGSGAFLLFSGNGRAAEAGLWAVPIAGAREPFFVQAAVDGDLSPDGKWLAYTSPGSEPQVYVASFPTPGERRRISTTRGRDPQWRSDGRELYYVADDQTLMAVPVTTGAELAVGVPEPLFRVSFDADSLQFGSAYAVAPDGQRFLVNESLAPAELRLIVTLSWAPDSR